ncbi:hypothetical protein GCM10028820_24880 [Tessaracoccus terricola]
MSDDDLLYPPVAPDPMWWALVAGLLLAAVALVVVALVLRARSRRPAPRVPTVAGLRQQSLAAIDAALAAHDAGSASATETCQELSRLVRSFTGQAGDGDADFSTAAQLRLAALADHRLEPTARFTAEIRAACFSPSANPDVAGFAERAREVVAAWR